MNSQFNIGNAWNRTHSVPTDRGCRWLLSPPFTVPFLHLRKMLAIRISVLYSMSTGCGRATNKNDNDDNDNSGMFEILQRLTATFGSFSGGLQRQNSA